MRIGRPGGLIDLRRASGVGVMLALLGAQFAWADAPPEARRLDGDGYREGLRRRGLIDLLEAALSEAPPGDEVEAELLRREILLATADDASRSAAARRAALDEANGILRSLIATRPADPRALPWRLELGQSLLYKRGDPFSSQVLYRPEPLPRRDGVSA